MRGPRHGPRTPPIGGQPLGLYSDAVTDLSAVFRPRAIAVVGASDDPVKIGGRPLAFLLRHGYAGRVFPVNPARATVQGLPAFPSIGAIPEEVDLAIVVVPAERVLESLEEAAAKGVRAAIVFSSGFAEVGEAGRVAQARLRELAERTGLRIIGPNCQGFAHLPSRLVATFASPFLEPGLATGPIAMVSQSGAMAGMIYEMARAAGLGLNYWVSTGNEADVQAAEILAEVVEDDETRVACCYMEDIKDAGRFRRALARAHRRGVPVFVLKSGRSAVGRRAASSHTGALAGEDAVYDAVFADWGAIRCADPAELLALPQAFLRYREAGRRVAILSNSGGLGVLSVDLCVDLGLVPAEFTPETTAVLRGALPDFAAAANPVDLTAQMLTDPGMLMRVLPALEADPGVDAIVFQIALLGAATDLGRLIGDVATVARATRKLVAVSCPQRPVVEAFRAGGVLAFDDASVALRSLACLAHATTRRARWLDRATLEAPPPPAGPRAPGRSRRRAVPQRVGEPAAPGAVRAAARGHRLRDRGPGRPRRGRAARLPGGGEGLRRGPAPQVGRGRRGPRALGPRRRRGGVPAHRGQRARRGPGRHPGRLPDPAPRARRARAGARREGGSRSSARWCWWARAGCSSRCCATSGCCCRRSTRPPPRRRCAASASARCGTACAAARRWTCPPPSSCCSASATPRAASAARSARST